MNILKSAYHGWWHQVVEHLVILISATYPLVKEVLVFCLLKIIVKPRKPKGIKAVAEEIKQRLNIVEGVHIHRILKFSVRSKHRVAFKPVLFGRVCRVDSVGVAEIDQVIISIFQADVV